MSNSNSSVLMKNRRNRDKKKKQSISEIDYERYSSGFLCIFLFSIVFVGVIYIYFYVILRSFILCGLLAAVTYPYALISFCKYTVSRKIQKLEMQFGEALQFISASISAGGTIESSFYEYARTNVNKGHDDALIKHEFNMIARRMELHESAVYSFSKFADRSGSSDIKVFSLALAEMATSGGNLSELIKNTSTSLRIKRETADEIDLILAGPKYNHRLVTVMPFAIVILMRMISPDYMEAIYHGYGHIVAMIAASLIIVAWIFGRNISNIQM